MPPRQQSPRTNWVFTLNNPTRDEEERFRQAVSRDYCRYVIYQWEQGENGTYHLQGYVQLKSKWRLGQLRDNLSDRAHWEPRRGNHQEADDYCSKADSRAVLPAPGPHRFGKPVTGSGQRTDLQEVKDALDDGATLKQISDEYFAAFCGNSRAFREYIGLHRPQRTWLTTVRVFWGPSGTGKSSRALAEAGPDAFWLRKPQGGNVWWDGYDGQENVVIDEFYGWIPRDLMQRLCDRYPLSVDTKGGSVPFLAKRVWITSNQDPESWWRIGLGAMERRLRAPIGEVVNMVDPRDEPWEEEPFPGPVPSSDDLQQHE